MQKTYIQPKMKRIEFAPNEYIAACYFVECEGSGGCVEDHGYYFTSYPFVVNDNNFNIGTCKFEGCGKSGDDNQDYNTKQISNEPDDIPYAHTTYNIFNWDDDEMVHTASSKYEYGLTSTASAS